MNTHLSSNFRRLSCDPAVFDSFSAFHPISFKRVLAFQSTDKVADDSRLLHAEEAHLAARNDATRRGIVEEYLRCGLLQGLEAANLKSAVDFFDGDFFEIMGLVYANAGMFRCALRWQRERIRELETQNPNSRSDEESVYASTGYCLYSLGLFEEAIAWSKSCIGPRQTAETVCEALLAYEAEAAGGVIEAIERSGARTRYFVNAPDPGDVHRTVERVKAAMKSFAPFHAFYIDWTARAPSVVQPEDVPFQAEVDGGDLIRHKMNLLFATCAQADALMEKGYGFEAKRLWTEAAMLEPCAGFVQERLKALL